MNLKDTFSELDISEQVGSDNYNLVVEKYMTSKLWRADIRDILNGLLVSVYGAVLTYLTGVFEGFYQLILKGEEFQIEVSTKTILIIAVFSGLSYLMKRFTSDRKGEFLGEN